MGQDGLPAVVLARADHGGGREGREPRGHLHRDAAGEVERPVRLQPAPAPHPVGQHGVDEQRPQDHEDEERPEAHPLDDRARHQRRGDDAERRLVGEEQQVRDRGPAAGARSRRRAGRRAEAADDPVAGVEGQRVAEHRPGHGDHGQRSPRSS